MSIFLEKREKEKATETFIFIKCNLTFICMYLFIYLPDDKKSEKKQNRHEKKSN